MFAAEPTPATTDHPAPPPPPPPRTIVDRGFMPEMPVDESDAVVVAEVVDRQVYLSDDRHSTYTEYTVKVAETVKPTSVRPGDMLAIIRRGGKVRLPEGRVVEWFVQGQGEPPVVGDRYLFFLDKITRSPGADAYWDLKLWRVVGDDIRAFDSQDIARVSPGESMYDGMPLLAVIAYLRVGVGKRPVNGKQ